MCMKFERKLAREKRRGEQQKQLFELRQQYDRYYPSRNGMRVSNVVLVVVVAAILAYTAAALFIQANTGIEVSSTLTSLWYTFWTAEILMLGGIKVSKVITNYKKHKADDDNDDQIYG